MKIAVLGYGVVGGGVVKIIDAHEKECANLEVKTILVRPGKESMDQRMVSEFDQILNDPEIELVAECLGGLEPAHTYVLESLKKGKHVVTPNKKMLATYGQELFEAAKANHVCLRYEATVGGGIPWIAALERLKRIDEVTSFVGIMNGTTNYILSAMTDQGLDFDEMLRNAQELGFAEADPTDDIDGYDVRYKCCLSAMTSFGIMIDPEEIPAYGIREINASDIAWAKKHDCTIKLIGAGKLVDGKPVVWVMPRMLKSSHLLAHVATNLNGIQAISTTLGPSTYIGQGAGQLPTAHAVVQDIVTIMDKGYEDIELPVSGDVCLDQLKGRFYLSGEQLDQLTDIKDSSVEDGFVTVQMGLLELMKHLETFEGHKPFVAMIDEDM